MLWSWCSVLGQGVPCWHDSTVYAEKECPIWALELKGVEKFYTEIWKKSENDIEVFLWMIIFIAEYKISDETSVFKRL